jgi:hypothetical protein
MALRSKSRTLNRLVTAEARRYNIPPAPLRSDRYHDYIVAHRSGKTHRPSDACSLCERYAKEVK